LDIETQSQKRLPKNFRDMEKVSDLESQKHELNVRREQIVTSYLFENLLLVQCGRFVKFSKL
jgi:hypothetical protein